MICSDFAEDDVQILAVCRVVSKQKILVLLC
ncbi:hypothetical protein TSPI_00001 [Trichinella spiralis]|uniref:Uncharacterized protein n=1 Tax=Trichinella spiralis TaxID=6334 RepID=A0ABR3K146_TRISP